MSMLPLPLRLRFRIPSLPSRGARLCVFAGIACGLAVCSPQRALAAGFDPYSTQDAVSATPAKSFAEGEGMQAPCRFDGRLPPLDLAGVVERTLCSNPQTRDAWAQAKIWAAQTGVGEAAYLPQMKVVAGVNREWSTVSAQGQPQFHSSGTSYEGSFELGWVLFDFGQRHAALEQARQMLAAANATQDAVLQSVFVEAARAYYSALAAQAARVASAEAEDAARESFMAADARFKAGAGALADKLQAQTSYAQASLDRVKAEAALRDAQGVLAVTMGLDANTPVPLQPDNRPLPAAAFGKSVDALIKEAEFFQPSLAAARAQLQAARADVDASKAQRWPVVSLTGGISRNNPNTEFAAATTELDRAVGLQVSIPLFQGFGQHYRVRKAQAQEEASAAELDKQRLQVSLNVWQSYQALQTGTEDLRVTGQLLQASQQSFQEAQGRYSAGVGTIIELLGAQSALANARQQRIQALSDWRIARLQLAADLGRLGLWALSNQPPPPQPDVPPSTP